MKDYLKHNEISVNDTFGKFLKIFKININGGQSFLIKPPCINNFYHDDSVVFLTQSDMNYLNQIRYG